MEFVSCSVYLFICWVWEQISTSNGSVLCPNIDCLAVLGEISCRDDEWMHLSPSAQDWCRFFFNVDSHDPCSCLCTFLILLFHSVGILQSLWNMVSSWYKTKTSFGWEDIDWNMSWSGQSVCGRVWERIWAGSYSVISSHYLGLNTWTDDQPWQIHLSTAGRVPCLLQGKPPASSTALGPCACPGTVQCSQETAGTQTAFEDTTAEIGMETTTTAV